MKSKTNFVCLNCQNQFTRWSGRCSVCGEWNTIVEQEPAAAAANFTQAQPAQLTSLKDLPTHSGRRLTTKLGEFDRVLGGDDPGIVPGSLILLAGSPGIGKSTLLLQAAASVDGAIYFSAEESLEQIKIRADRLGLAKNSLRLSAERDLGRIIAALAQAKPSLAIIDSIQTIFDESVAGTPGSIVQVRESCWRLQQLAKSTNIPIIIVGHVTKEGTVAGPRLLEHLVDVVLYLEGEKRTGLRILRGEKNRFGSTEEVGIWQLTTSGLESVADPGKLFASLVTDDAPGRSLTITLEGSRAFIVEIQALVTKTSFGYPKRAAQGLDLNRLNLLLAVLENRLNLPTSQYDVYVNVVGGFTVRDPGIDLAIAAAIISSLNKKPLPTNQVFLGEVGLLGEIRPAFSLANRLKEAKRLKYSVVEKLRSVKELKGIFA
jgi:DNA repair protein RadA/Sms